MSKIYKNIMILLSTALLVSSCGEDSLDSAQITIKSVEQVKTINDINSVMHGAINRLTNTSYYGRDYIIYGDTYFDNTYANGSSGRFTSISQNKLNSNSGYSEDTWDILYKVVSSANLMILAKIDYAADEKGRYEHLLGEAYFFRALAHFDALRFYGQQNVDVAGGMNALGVPYEKKFRPSGEELLPKRSTVGEVKQFLYEDLTKAIELAKPANDYSTLAYVNSGAIKALFIRVALYFKDYDKVIELSEPLVNGAKIQDEEAYVKGWASQSSSNWLFALNNNESDNPGINGLSNIYQNTSYGDIVAFDFIESIFESTDIRGLKGMVKNEKGYRNYGKYPLNNPAVYQIPVFRIEEIIFSYAEALYFKGKKAESMIEFNKVNKARGASEITSINEDIIIEQWRKEFYFEGFRFHTLARFKKDVKVNSNDIEKDIPYGDHKFAFPIPQAEINRSSLKQNKGY